MKQAYTEQARIAFDDYLQNDVATQMRRQRAWWRL